MTRRLVLEPAAETEFLDAASWYSARSPALGVAYRHAVAELLETIDEKSTAIPHRAAGHP